MHLLVVAKEYLIQVLMLILHNTAVCLRRKDVFIETRNIIIIIAVAFIMLLFFVEGEMVVTP